MSQSQNSVTETAKRQANTYHVLATTSSRPQTDRLRLQRSRLDLEHCSRHHHRPVPEDVEDLRPGIPPEPRVTVSVRSSVSLLPDGGRRRMREWSSASAVAGPPSCESLPCGG